MLVSSPAYSSRYNVSDLHTLERHVSVDHGLSMCTGSSHRPVKIPPRRTAGSNTTLEAGAGFGGFLAFAALRLLRDARAVRGGASIVEMSRCLSRVDVESLVEAV
jgi:hypothetical protein